MGILLVYMNQLFFKARFNNQATYEVLRKVVTEHGCLGEYLLFKGLSSYENLKETIIENVKNFEIFVSNLSFKESHPTTKSADVEIMKDDGKEVGRRRDSIINSLAERFQNLVLTMQKRQIEPISGELFKERPLRVMSQTWSRIRQIISKANYLA